MSTNGKDNAKKIPKEAQRTFIYWVSPIFKLIFIHLRLTIILTAD